MNLNKSKQKQKLINEIRNEGEVYIGQEGVSKGITEFYRKLYSRENLKTQSVDDDFYNKCPKRTKPTN
jgi:hypothetical protein